MNPVFCTVRHSPPDSYGDCVRACIASVLEHENVPHFFHDGNGELAFDRMREYLRDYHRIPAYFPISGEALLSEVLHHMATWYPGVEYLLWCQNRDGDHCVVGRDDKIIHDPSWYKTTITGPHSQGVWILIVLAKV